MKPHASKLEHLFLKDINPVIRFLILSDTIIIGAGGLLGPIFALFIEGYIQGGNEIVAGIAAGVYMFSKSILQIPAAHIMDRIKGEKDDYWFMFIFSLLIALMPICYLFVSTPSQLYLVQFLLGLFTAFTFPSFMAIFTRHIDKQKEGTEWGIYFTLVDISGASLAIIGGYLALTIGFPKLILLVVLLSVIGSLLLIPIKPYIKK